MSDQDQAIDEGQEQAESQAETDVNADANADANESNDDQAEFENPLAMSDEDFLNQGMPDFGDDYGNDDGDTDGGGAENDSANVDGDPNEEDYESEAESENEGEADKQTSNKEGTENAEVDYAAIGERIIQPFKANGEEMQVRDANEAISLMQQGANYHKKMKALGPHLRTVKTLERAGIDANTLNYLIDLHNKKPGAIGKLVRESEFEPMDADEDNQEDYRPTNYQPSDKDMAIETAIDDLKTSPAYDRTLEVAGKLWDSTSRQAFIDTPQMLHTLNGHMETGVFDVIDKEINRRRTFGQLNGLSDIAAYQQVGDELNEAGAFNHLGSDDGTGTGKQTTKKANANQPNKRVPPKRGSNDANLNARRRAASPTRAASKKSKSKVTDEDFNPLAMSDEDFMKQFGSQLQ